MAQRRDFMRNVPLGGILSYLNEVCTSNSWHTKKKGMPPVSYQFWYDLHSAVPLLKLPETVHLPVQRVALICNRLLLWKEGLTNIRKRQRERLSNKWVGLSWFIWLLLSLGDQFIIPS